ncbi:MAG: F0F1 ATP synthase subunit B [Verrucomicrobia bacterium]|nr:F0F1 ATP synthase subunit B [Verrucomicrobiota bacterium]
MSDANTTHAVVEVPAHGDAGAHSPNPMQLEGGMVVLTWIAFGIMAAVLYKVAWKPILAGLDAREGRIRQALDDADKARATLAQMEETRRTALAETELQCKAMIGRARDAAAEAASHVEAKAHERVKVLYENAERDIEAMKNRIITEIRHEQANLIVQVSGRLIAQNLDAEKNRVLADKLIAEF